MHQAIGLLNPAPAQVPPAVGKPGAQEATAPAGLFLGLLTEALAEGELPAEGAPPGKAGEAPAGAKAQAMPEGLLKREELPPGLAQRSELPRGLALLTALLPAQPEPPAEEAPPSEEAAPPPPAVPAPDPVIPPVVVDAAPEPAPSEEEPAPPDTLPVMAAVAAQASPVTEEAPESAPAPVQSIPVAEVPADPKLEAFVRQAARQVEGETQPAAAPAKPSFGDMVRMVLDAEQTPPAEPAQTAPQTGPEAEPVAQVSAKPASDVTANGTEEAPLEPARPEVDPEKVTRQVSRFIKVAVEGKRSEVRLQLHPEFLGPVAVKLVLNEGALRANLITQDASVKAALEASMEQLKGRLSEQGIQVEQVQVSVGSGSDFGQSQQSNQGERRQPQQPGQEQRTGQQHRAEHQPEEPEPQPRPQTPAWGVRGARLNSLA